MVINVTSVVSRNYRADEGLRAEITAALAAGGVNRVAPFPFPPSLPHSASR